MGAGSRGRRVGQGYIPQYRHLGEHFHYVRANAEFFEDVGRDHPAVIAKPVRVVG
jgi:hypothetical protein